MKTYKLTQKDRKKGYIWKCKKCGNLSKYKEPICEKCYGEDV